MAKDPVCKMEVEEKKSAAKSEYERNTYYFCCQSCKEAFDKEPEKYLKEWKIPTSYFAQQQIKEEYLYADG